MTGGFWPASRETELNEFIENIFNPLYEMSADEKCYNNPTYMNLLKECGKFDPFYYERIPWRRNKDENKNKFILMILTKGGYTEDNLKIPENELKQKLRFIFNLKRYVNFVYNPSTVSKLIHKYTDQVNTNDKELLEMFETIDMLFVEDTIGRFLGERC